jgi:hypothetical protein
VGVEVRVGVSESERVSESESESESERESENERESESESESKKRHLVRAGAHLLCLGRERAHLRLKCQIQGAGHLGVPVSEHLDVSV